MCCVPTINVTSVTVNTTTNVATLALDAPLPDRGAFRLRFCNCSGAQLDPFCVTPCTNPQAKVQFSYTPTGGAEGGSGFRSSLTRGPLWRCGSLRQKVLTERRLFAIII